MLGGLGLRPLARRQHDCALLAASARAISRASMKKTFPLHDVRKADARVRDAIRHEVRKYVKRERQKLLPEDFTVWEFDCQVGATPESAETLALAQVGAAIDRVAEAGSSSVFLEITARPARRSPADGRTAVPRG